MDKDYKITNLRFIAIILVVLAHSIIIYRTDWELYNSIYKPNLLISLDYFIYLFHMPLFFSISGYLYFLSNKKHDFKIFFTKKLKRLIIPYIIVGILWMMPIRYICNYSNYINHNIIYNIFINVLIGKDNGHLWYLPTLFLIFIIAFFMEKYIKNEQVKNVLVLLLSIFGYFIPSFIGLSFTNIIWFYLGKYILKTGQNNKIICNILLSLLSLVAYFYIFYTNMSLYGVEDFILILLKYIFCFNFIKFLYAIVKNKNIKTIDLISNNSYGIYLFHSPLIYFTFCFLPNINPCVMIIINFLFFGIISFIISYLLGKSKLKFVIGG